ncbi:MAG: hypothetical protein OXG78_13160 [Chloroflexi bacterium]|nr:hypothetical protein [Chloroflexota bacterium]
MKRSPILVYLVFVLLILLPLAIGQDNAGAIEPKDMEMVNPEANISFPPPVYVVRDSVDIRGTVTLAGMRNFFVEFRPLVLDMMSEDSDDADQWFPATLPRIAPVTDDILGSWNTVPLRDGLYELRLTINTDADEPSYFRVSPVRVENNPPEFVAEQQVVEVVPPTDVPEPTATPDSSPHVTALVNSNVRDGDSTFYRIVGGLHEGDTAKIKGISSFGTGWFYIELDSGRRGFIHPNIVRAEGDLSALPRINPPPLPPTAIPQPTAIPVPSTGANLRITHVQIDPHPATCNEAYEIQVTVVNDGNAPASRGALVEVRDSRADGAGRVTTGIGITALAAGETRTFTGHLTQVQYYEELHHINLIVDVNNEIAETNENDNQYATAPYILQRGNCG